VVAYSQRNSPGTRRHKNNVNVSMEWIGEVNIVTRAGTSRVTDAGTNQEVFAVEGSGSNMAALLEEMILLGKQISFSREQAMHVAAGFTQPAGSR